MTWQYGLPQKRVPVKRQEDENIKMLSSLTGYRLTGQTGHTYFYKNDLESDS